MDCSLPGSSVRGILQARILEWVAMHSSRESSPPRDRTWSLASPALAGGFFTNCAAATDAYRIMFIVGGEFAQSTHTRVTNIQTKGQNISSPPEASPRSPQARPNPKMSLVQL